MPHPEEELSAFVSGELNEIERKLVEEHLTVCAQCMEHLRRLQKLDEILLEQHDELEPSHDFVQGVIAQTDREKIVRSFFPHKRLTILVAAAVIAFFAFLLSLQKEIPSAPPIVKERSDADTTHPPALSPVHPREEHISPQPPTEPSVMEDAELIAHLEELQDMELIQNLQDVDRLDLAVILANSGEMQ